MNRIRPVGSNSSVVGPALIALEKESVRGGTDVDVGVFEILSLLIVSCKALSSMTTVFGNTLRTLVDRSYEAVAYGRLSLL